MKIELSDETVLVIFKALTQRANSFLFMIDEEMRKGKDRESVMKKYHDLITRNNRAIDEISLAFSNGAENDPLN